MVELREKNYITVSLPRGLGVEIDSILRVKDYWPSRSAFVREAVIQKIKEENNRIKKYRPNE